MTDPVERPETVLAVYRAKPARRDELLAALARHQAVLRRAGLVTDRAARLLTPAAPGSDDVLLEIFEWRSVAHVEAAHTHPEVAASWDELAELATYEPPAALGSQPFTHVVDVVPPG